MHRRDVTIILLCTLLLAGCTGLFFDEPTITLKEIHVRQLSLTDASLVFVAEIQNPNSYDLRLKSLDYTVHLSGQETGGGSLQKEISSPRPPRPRSRSLFRPASAAWEELPECTSPARSFPTGSKARPS